MVDHFANEKTVNIVAMIPHEVRLHSITGPVIYTRRWPIGHFSKISKAGANARWRSTSEALFHDNPGGPQVALVFKPKNTFADGAKYCGIYVQLAALGDLPQLALRMVLWLERADGQRNFKFGECLEVIQ